MELSIINNGRTLQDQALVALHRVHHHPRLQRPPCLPLLNPKAYLVVQESHRCPFLNGQDANPSSAPRFDHLAITDVDV